MIIVAILTVRRSELAAFRQFESIATRVMSEHGGRLERTVVVDDGTGELLTEIHLVRFADPAAFASYRESSELSAHLQLRDRSVVKTELFFGEDGPKYL